MAQTNTGIVIPLFRKIANGFQKIFISAENVILKDNSTTIQDYVGVRGKAITDVAIGVTQGSVKYRVHVKGGSWLPYVTGYNTSDGNNGYAGNGREIDAIEVYYNTPSAYANKYGYKKAKYRVAVIGKDYYSWQYDNEKGNGMDGYAGAFGRSMDRFQICPN